MDGSRNNRQVGEVTPERVEIGRDSQLEAGTQFAGGFAPEDHRKLGPRRVVEAGQGGLGAGRAVDRDGAIHEPDAGGGNRRDAGRGDGGVP